MALIDIDVVQVNEEKKQRVLQEVIGQQGPPDGTVIITSATGEFDDDMVDVVVETFSECGDIILVRFVGDDMWLVFKQGRSALQALQLNNSKVNSFLCPTHICHVTYNVITLNDPIIMDAITIAPSLLEYKYMKRLSNLFSHILYH